MPKGIYPRKRLACVRERDIQIVVRLMLGEPANRLATEHGLSRPGILYIRERMMAGPDAVVCVRQYLDAKRGKG